MRPDVIGERLTFGIWVAFLAEECFAPNLWALVGIVTEHVCTGRQRYSLNLREHPQGGVSFV